MDVPPFFEQDGFFLMPSDGKDSVSAIGAGNQSYNVSSVSLCVYMKWIIFISKKDQQKRIAANGSI